jgi:hypothetical protein
MHAIAYEKNAKITVDQVLEFQKIENLIETQAKDGFYFTHIEIEPQNTLVIIDRLKAMAINLSEGICLLK